MSGRARRRRRGPRQSKDWTQILAVPPSEVCGRDDCIRHRCAIQSKAGMQGERLQLDVEVRSRIDAQCIRQGRDRGTIVRLLVGIKRCIATVRTDPPDIVAAQVLNPKRADHRASLSEPRSISGPGDVGVKARIVRDHHDLISRHRHIQFQRVDTHCQRAGESDQRILGKQAARTAMAMQVDPSPHRHRAGSCLCMPQDDANAW